MLTATSAATTITLLDRIYVVAAVAIESAAVEYNLKERSALPIVGSHLRLPKNLQRALPFCKELIL